MATLSPARDELNESPPAPREIEVPAPTAWPFILALGAALLFAGLVTSTSVSCLGALLSLAGCVGWFREVFPREHEEVVPIVPEDIRVTTDRRVVERLPVLPDQVRAWLPGSHLSDISRCERRIGGEHRDGGIGVRLWRAESR